MTELSPTAQALYKPHLERVRLFGWNPTDLLAIDNLRNMFAGASANCLSAAPHL